MVFQLVQLICCSNLFGVVAITYSCCFSRRFMILLQRQAGGLGVGCGSELAMGGGAGGPTRLG